MRIECESFHDNPGTKLSTHLRVMQNASLSITLRTMPMKYSKWNMKGAKTARASPFHTPTPCQPHSIKWWEKANRAWMTLQIHALGTSFPFVLCLIKTTTRSWQLQQHLTSPQECSGTREWKKRKQCKRNGRPERPAHISSLLTVLRLTPGILVKVYVQVSVRVAFKKNERNWLVYG